MKTKPYSVLFFHCISLSFENTCMIIRILDATCVLNTQRSWLEFPFVAGSWNMDCFEKNSTVLSECEYFHPWHVYCPVNVLCWLNQDSKNRGRQKVAMYPNNQLWRPEGKSIPSTRLFIMSASRSCWKE